MMNQISEKLVQSLEQLKQLQEQGVVAIRSVVLSRVHRQRLLKYGFIKEVIKGWYIPARPDEQAGDSTSWYTSYWDFCAAYLSERFGAQWCLSAEQSIRLHIGDTTVPPQLLVRSPKGQNNKTAFIHDTSLFEIQTPMPASGQLTVLNQLNVYNLPAALVNCQPKHFIDQPISLRTALSMVSDASDILNILLENGQSVVAGRLVGAFRNIGRDLIADNILKGMSAADFNVKETNPFAEQTQVILGKRVLSPYVNRMQLMWAKMRDEVIATFPEPPQTALTTEDYLIQIEEKYRSDAYNSLSIEGYRVTQELIEQIRTGHWDPDNKDADKKHLDGLAAKGYWEAFQLVKQAVAQVLDGKNAGAVLESVHSDWYLALFGPTVASGIVKQSDLAGYRNGPVFIRQSKHSPPNKAALRDMMPTLFDLLAEEADPRVRVVLGHFFFVYIHPYFDGNGRMARFLMNLMMAAGGYPWTIVPVERRSEYMEALETASTEHNIQPFSRFLASLM